MNQILPVMGEPANLGKMEVSKHLITSPRRRLTASRYRLALWAKSNARGKERCSQSKDAGLQASCDFKYKAAAGGDSTKELHLFYNF